jgi:hypothetical protein
MNTRFKKILKTIEEAKNYLIARSKQLLKYNCKLISIDEYEWGLNAMFYYNNKIYQSIILLKDFCGKGLYKTLVTHDIITTIDCSIVDYLDKYEISYCCLLNIHSYEYTLIENFYGDQKTKRSGVHLMNHIDEGLYILQKIGASMNAQKAYCLHPIIQSDDALKENIDLLKNTTIDNIVIINAIEYRSIANDYLSHKKINYIGEINLSPLRDVNDMLIADKIQNYKDFQLYHKDTHPRSQELTEYFENWFERLAISKQFYNECVNFCS